MIRSTPSKQKSARWVGEVEGFYNGVLHGWALDTDQPDARVVLEVCLHGEPLACVVADVAHTMVLIERKDSGRANVPMDDCHGFVADLGAAMAQHGNVLTVRVANTDVVLPGYVDFVASPIQRARPLSKVYGDGGLRLHGWVIDPANPECSITVRAFVGNKEIATAVASMRTPATRSFEADAHGFVLDLPLHLADGQRHSVRVVDAVGQPLDCSPIDVCCYSRGGKHLLANDQKFGESLLATVINAYEHFLSRGIGLKHYRQWSVEFESPSLASPTSSLATGMPAVKIAFVVTGDAKPAAFARTRASLEMQTGAHVQIFEPNRSKKGVLDFANLLQRALDSGSDFVACIRAGDTLLTHASLLAADGLKSSDSQLVYTDSEADGTPWFKPAWNLEYALGSDFPLELMVIRIGAVQAYIAHHAVPENASDLSWQMLATLWKHGGRAIVHVPHVLYVFQSTLTANEQRSRMLSASGALQQVEPSAALVAHVNPLAEPDRVFIPRRIVRTLSPRALKQTVSLIIPTRDQAEMLERCITSMQRFTDWPRLEILVVDNDSVQSKTKSYFRKLVQQGVKVLSYPGRFNFSAINNYAVGFASGEIVGLVNNDIEALHAGWLEEMLGHLMSPGVGAVGAKLLWPNGMVQHGGVLLGVGNVAGHFGNLLADADWGDHGRNQLVQQVSAVTAACLLLRKRDYIGVGGMDENAFPVAFNDVDLCLKLRRNGQSIVWTPYARLLHAESASRGHEDTPQKMARAQREVRQLRLRWGPTLLRDPAYHPSLSLDYSSHAFGALALPPRDRLPRGAGIFDELQTLN